MLIINTNGKLASRWYRKPTDTGLGLNYHALAPLIQDGFLKAGEIGFLITSKLNELQSWLKGSRNSWDFI